MCDRLDLPESPRIALQGFGNAGSWFARAAVQKGYIVTAVSDSSGMVSCHDGIDIEALQTISLKIQEFLGRKLPSRVLTAGTPGQLYAKISEAS